MEPRLVDLPEFEVVGLAGRYVVGKAEGIPALWTEFVRTWQRSGRPFPAVSYGVCYDERESEGSGGEAPAFTYMAAFELGPDDPAPAGLETRTVPANRYAVFPHRGPLLGIQDTYAAIFDTWLPRSGQRRAAGPDFERYDERFDEETMSGEVDIYVPVARAP